MSYFDTAFSSGLTIQVVNATGAHAFTSAYTSYEEDNEILPELTLIAAVRCMTSGTTNTWLELDYNYVASGVTATTATTSLRPYSEG